MIVKEGQNIFDVTIEAYGSINYLFDLLSDNGLNVDSELYSGMELIIDRTKGDNEIVNKIIKNNITLNNNLRELIEVVEEIIYRVTTDGKYRSTTDGNTRIII